MSSPRRLLLAVLCGVLVLSAVTVGVAAFAIGRYGTVVVRVEEKGAGGDSVSLRIPAAVIHAPALLLPRVSIRSHDPDLPPEVMPALRNLCEALRRAPDGTLVRIDRPRERVLVEKRGGSLRVHVDDEQANVDVSIPLATLALFLDRFEIEVAPRPRSEVL